jgi:hypothetical protein
MFRRSRFAEVVRRQLDLFVEENADLLADAEEAFAAYDAAGADEAEARYETYLDRLETAQDELVALRDAYARTLDAETAEEYEAAFDAAVRKRLPRYALGLD